MIGVHYTEVSEKLGDKGDKLLTKKGTRLIHLGYGFVTVEKNLMHVTRMKMWEVDGRKEIVEEITTLLKAAEAGNIWRGDW
jgi:hypothetical protein